MAKPYKTYIIISLCLVVPIGIHAQIAATNAAAEFKIMTWAGKTESQLETFNRKVEKAKQLSDVKSILSIDPSYSKVRILVLIHKGKEFRVWFAPVIRSSKNKPDSIYTRSKGNESFVVNSIGQLKELFSGNLLLLDTITVQINLSYAGLADDGYFITANCKYQPKVDTILLSNKNGYVIIPASKLYKCYETYEAQLFNKNSKKTVLGSFRITLGDDFMKQSIQKLNRALSAENFSKNVSLHFIQQVIEGQYGKISIEQIDTWLNSKQ